MLPITSLLLVEQICGYLQITHTQKVFDTSCNILNNSWQYLFYQLNKISVLYITKSKKIYNIFLYTLPPKKEMKKTKTTDSIREKWVSSDLSSCYHFRIVTKGEHFLLRLKGNAKHLHWCILIKGVLRDLPSVHFNSNGKTLDESVMFPHQKKNVFLFIKLLSLQFTQLSRDYWWKNLQVWDVSYLRCLK